MLALQPQEHILLLPGGESILTLRHVWASLQFQGCGLGLEVLPVASQHVTPDVIGPLSSIQAFALDIGVLPIVPQHGFRNLGIA